MWNRNGNFKVLLGAVLLTFGLIGYIALAVLLKGDPDAATIRGSFLFLIAPASALLVGGQFQEVRDQADRIEKNTNGVLSKRVQDIADAAAENAVQKAIDSPNLPGVGAPNQ